MSIDTVVVDGVVVVIDVVDVVVVVGDVLGADVDSVVGTGWLREIFNGFKSTDTLRL